MRIAIATDFYAPWAGGPATFIENFRGYLAHTAHHVEIIAPSPTGHPYRERRERAIVHRLPAAPFPLGHDLRVSYRWDAARSALLAAQPDVVQIHHPFPLSAAVAWAARHAGIPLVAVNHTIPECSLYGLRRAPALHAAGVALFGAYLRRFLACADAICTPTRTAATFLRAMGVTRPVAVISNGIDVARFQPTRDQRAARAAFGLPDRPIALYVGRLDPEKDLATLIRAAALAFRHVDAHLAIGGDGTERARLERLARDLRLDDRVTFFGYVPSAALPRLYQAATVYCMTGSVELQSISTLEALASGVPAIAVKAGALPELVHNGGNGMLVPPGDMAAFADALRALLSQPALARRMGEAGRRTAEEHALGLVACRHLELLEMTARGHAAVAKAGKA